MFGVWAGPLGPPKVLDGEGYKGFWGGLGPPATPPQRIASLV